MRAICSALIAGAIGLPPAFADQAPRAATADSQRLRDEDVLLLAIRLDHIILSDAVPAYPIGKGVMLPLGELCRLLDFAITIDGRRGTADGVFIDERRKFQLDLGRQTVITEGASKRFDPAKVALHDEDVYVDTQVLSEWFPLDISIDLLASLVKILPREPLPAQVRRQRDLQIQKTLAALGSTQVRYPRVKNPYQLWGSPFVDQMVRVTLGGGPQGGLSTGTEFATSAAADVLFTETSLHLLGTANSGVSDFRVSVGRTDPDGGLLGVVNARQLMVGEVLYPGVSLVSLPFSGRGALISNYPLLRQTQFDRHRFRGELASGWEVELYQNGSLIAFQQSRPDGLYEFDVPLFFRLNTFRLVFYGPQGQRREETLRFNVGESLTPPGQFHYQFVRNEPKTATRRSLFELDAGLTKHFSSSFALATVDLENGHHRYAKAGVQGFWNVVFASANYAVDQQGGSVSEAGFQTGIGSMGFSLRRAQLNGFESEVFRPLFGPIRQRTTASVYGDIGRWLGRRVPFTFELLQDKLVSGQTVNFAMARVSTFHRGLFLSNRLHWVSAGGPEQAVMPMARGELLVSKAMRGFGLRGDLIYNLEPRFGLDDLSVMAESLSESGYLFQFGATRGLHRGAATQFIANINKAQGSFGLGVRTNYSRAGGFAVGLTLSAGLSHDPRAGDWHTQARPVAGMGAASALVFLDANANGRRDPDEQPLEGAGFFVNRATTPTITGPNGMAFLQNLPAYQDTELSLAPATLEDPLWLPREKGVRVMSRPGKAAVIDFPVIATGEITGTLYMRRSGRTRELAGVLVELVDEQGQTVKSSRSAFDGFYELTQIPPGRYRLQVAPEDNVRHRLKALSSDLIEIMPEGTVRDGVDLTVAVEDPDEPAASDAAVDVEGFPPPEPIVPIAPVAPVAPVGPVGPVAPEFVLRSSFFVRPMMVACPRATLSGPYWSTTNRPLSVRMIPRSCSRRSTG